MRQSKEDAEITRKKVMELYNQEIMLNQNVQTGKIIEVVTHKVNIYLGVPYKYSTVKTIIYS